MRRTFPSMSLAIALATSMSGCGENSQRDVYSGYNAYQRCLDDWGTQEICKDQIPESQAQAMGLHPNYGSHFIYLWGPRYYPSEGRVAYYNNSYYAPMNTRSMGVSTFSGSSSEVAGFTSSRVSGASVRGLGGVTGHAMSGAGE